MVKGKTDEAPKEAPAAPAAADDYKAVFLYNGPSGYDINFAGRGKVAIKVGENVTLNLVEATQMRAFLAIIKEVNRPKTNFRTTFTKPDADGNKDQLKIARFSTVTMGAGIPEVLQKHSYSASNMLTDVEEKAVLAICPEFWSAPGHGRTAAMARGRGMF